jgi:hypothetical protein
METDGNSVINRLCQQGFSQLTAHEQGWVIEMTKTRHPYWDPLIQDAYLHRHSLSDEDSSTC